MDPTEVPPFPLTVDDFVYEAQVARVSRLSLLREDHGIFTLALAFEGAGWGQSLGLPELDEWDPVQQRRVGTAYGLSYVMAVVERLGSPEEARGRRVVVLRAKPYGDIVGFATLADDGRLGEPFLPRALFRKYYPELAK